jgi:hypothetical protein
VLTPWKKKSSDLFLVTAPLNSHGPQISEISNRKTYSMKTGGKSKQWPKSFLRSLKLCLIVIETIVNLGARSGYSIPVCSKGRSNVIRTQWNPLRYGDVVCKLDNIFDLLDIMSVLRLHLRTE